jgi:hypothetical protein
MINKGELAMTDSEMQIRLNYQQKGFDVLWDEHGLEIRTIDYRVGCLRLSWETIRDLAQRVGAVSVCPPS